jgi:hypothetical protein
MFLVYRPESLLQSLNQQGRFSNVQVGGRTFEDVLNQLFQQYQPQGNPPASKKAIESLPIVPIEQHHVDQKLECPICKDAFQIGVQNPVVQLPCKHLYHNECIVPWLQQHNTCPVCRYELETDNPEYEARRRQRQRQRQQQQQQQQQQMNGQSQSSHNMLQPCCAMQRITGEACCLLNDPTFQTLQCGCVFHTECLNNALRVQTIHHHRRDESQQFKCPSCMRQTSIQHVADID